MSALGRNLQLCFTKIKLAGENLPTLPSPDDQNQPVILKNYNSIYDYTVNHSSQSLTHSSSSSPTTSSSSEPDFATIFASQRFFFSSPGRSNSIVESAESSNRLIVEKENGLPHSDTSSMDECNQSFEDYKSQGDESLQSPDTTSTVKDSTVAVHTYSPDPYKDFRQSMQEMVESRHLVDVKANWDYLHELLLCYLALNPKSTHKFIIAAFSDLLVNLLSSQSECSHSGIGCETSSQAPHHM